MGLGDSALTREHMAYGGIAWRKRDQHDRSALANMGAGDPNEQIPKILNPTGEMQLDHYKSTNGVVTKELD